MFHQYIGLCLSSHSNNNAPFRRWGGRGAENLMESYATQLHYTPILHVVRKDLLTLPLFNYKERFKRKKNLHVVCKDLRTLSVSLPPKKIQKFPWSDTIVEAKIFRSYLLKFFFLTSDNYVGVRDNIGQWHGGLLYLFQEMYHFALLVNLSWTSR